MLIKGDLEQAVLYINRANNANVAIKDLFVVIVNPLDDFVTGRLGRTIVSNLGLTLPIQARL